MADGNLLPLSNVNAFTTGRKRAGMGWYQGQRPLWMEIAVPVVEGASKGAQAGIGAYAGGAGGASGAKAAGATQSAYTASSPEVSQSQIGGGPTLGELITQSQAQAPETAAQGFASESFAPGQYATPPMADPLALERTTVRRIQTPEEKRAAQRQRDVAKAMQLLYSPRTARDEESTTYIRSSRTLKREITRSDDHRALGEVLNTPVYRYRYEDEEPGTQGRLGPMAEEVPPSWQIKMGDHMGIKMSPYLGALHGSIRALGREVETLKERLNG